WQSSKEGLGTPVPIVGWLQRTNLWHDRTKPRTGVRATIGRSVRQLEGTMRPTPDGLLPAHAAIIILGCLFVFLSALWLFVITKAMIAIGVGAVALFTAGACAYTHRYALKPLSSALK